MVTPPDKNGWAISAEALAAARIAGATDLQKSAAHRQCQSFGLQRTGESVPRVDKIVGPGGIFLWQTAKRKGVWSGSNTHRTK